MIILILFLCSYAHIYKQDAINSAKKRGLGERGEGGGFRHLTCCTQAIKNYIAFSHVKDMIKMPIRKRTPPELDMLKLPFLIFIVTLTPSLFLPEVF